MKTKTKSRVWITMLLAAMLLSVANIGVLTPVTAAVPVAGEKYIIYSETSVGTTPSLALNAWSGANIGDSADAGEGSVAKSVDAYGTPLWGLGYEHIPDADLSAYADGFLFVKMKSSANATFQMGFTSPSQNAVVEMVPGNYGYDNDSLWHQIIIPVADLIDSNPSADIAVVNNVFALVDDDVNGDALVSAGDIYFDDVYYVNGPKLVFYADSGVDEAPDMWNNWGNVYAAEIDTDGAEGTNSTQLTIDTTGWWGGSFEHLSKPNVSDFTAAEEMILVFSIKTNYTGEIRVGVQTGTYNENMTDVYTFISNDVLGYDGISWTTVVLPFETFTGDVLGINFDELAASMYLSDDTDVQNDTILLDDIHWQAGGEVRITLPKVENVVISLNATRAIELNYTFWDQENDADQSIIEWYKNGTQMSDFDNMLAIPAVNVSIWDLWIANVTPSDGTDFGELVTSNSLLVTPPRFEDPSFLIIYSELSPGVPYGEELEWVDWAGTASIGFVADGGAFEGIEYGNATNLATATWWSISAATEPRGSGDLSAFSTGTLNFMIKTTYSGGLRFGFNILGGVDAFVSIHSGDYGYINDGDWHQVTIPVADIYTTTPEVYLAIIEHIFIISGVAGEMDTAPVYFDDIYYKMTEIPSILHAAIVFAPRAEGRGLNLEYEFSDPQGDPDQSRIRWYKNKVLVEAYNDLTHVNASDMLNGDEWYAIVTPFDGTNTGKPVKTNTVRLGEGYPPEDDDDGIPGFPIATFLGIFGIAVLLSIKKYKN